MRYEEYSKKIIDDYLNGSQIGIEEYPDFELYVDQASTFMNQKLAAYKRNEKDQVITNTMIKNYTKHKMMPGSTNRKYSKEHLIFLSMIFYLKRNFQMDEIEKVMKPLIENFNSDFDEKIDFLTIYQGILDCQKKERELFQGKIKSEIESIKNSLNRSDLSDDDMLEVFMLITSLSMKADAQRFVAEKLLDEYFVKPTKEKIKSVKRPKLKFDNKDKVAPKEAKKKKVKETTVV
jgi:DNA-binding transcriptional MerR regulator